jgi:hypothetical protein
LQIGRIAFVMSDAATGGQAVAEGHYCGKLRVGGGGWLLR